MLRRVLAVLMLLVSVGGAVILEEAPPGVFPENYDKEEPPWKRGQPANVYIQLDVMDISKIDEGDMEFHLACFVDELWVDKRLNFSTFQSEEGTVLPPYIAKDIWVPDLVMDTVKHGKIFQLSVPNKLLILMPNGWFMKTTRYFLVTNCHMNFEFYPMDTQYCYITFASSALEDFKMDLHWVDQYIEPMDSIDVVGDIQSSKYLIKDPKTEKKTEKWMNGYYSTLYANFTFERRLSNTVFNDYIPSTLIVFLSWISFWIDISAIPARVTLGVTSLLTLATQIVQAKSKLPTISYMTAVDVWLFVCLFMVFSSLIEFAICYSRYTNAMKSTLSPQYPPTTKKIVDLRVLRSRSSGRSRQADRSSDRSASGDKFSFNKRDMLLDKVSRKLFPSIFAAFAVGYWSYYLTVKK